MELLHLEKYFLNEKDYFFQLASTVLVYFFTETCLHLNLYIT